MLAVILCMVGLRAACAHLDFHDFQPPVHPSLQDFHFLEVLKVQKLQGNLQSRRSSKPPQGRQQAHQALPQLGLPNSAYLPDFSKFGFGAWMDSFDTFRALANFPPALKPEFHNPKELGAGGFAVTFLTNRTSTGEMVAVKVLQLQTTPTTKEWLTPRMYYNGGPVLKAHIDQSREECQRTQAIHKADKEDPEASKHVMQCLNDAITPGIMNQTLPDLPLHLVLSFAGTDDVDKWWDNKLKSSLSSKQYVQLLKSAFQDIFTGLKFLAESKGIQWIHHDLKPQNMVMNEDSSSEPLRFRQLQIGEKPCPRRLRKWSLSISVP